MDMKQIVAEQDRCYELLLSGKSREDISKETNLTLRQVRRRLDSAQKRSRLDPTLVKQLAQHGLVDLAGLHSGWILNKDKNGSGLSTYFYLGPDGERIDFADAMREVLSDIPKFPKIKYNRAKYNESAGKDFATWVALADLHVGAYYGEPVLEEQFYQAFDQLIQGLPPAEHAVLFELGDLLDANDHKGVTPASQNPMDVKRGDFLNNTQVALRLLRWGIYRLLQAHQTVEVHLIKGNHDPSAYVAVLLALGEHFANNPRVNIVILDDEYRVISWGACAAFPHHGDTLKWDQLKDVFADQFPDEWAAAKAHRLIMTAHLHHDRKRDLLGATAEHFRTLQRPSAWAKARGLYSRGSLTAITIHKEEGERWRTLSNIKPPIGG